MRTFLTAILFAALSLLISCEDATNNYFFENPVAGSVLNNVKCVNGSVSYIGFVVDNTEKYGARIMKITGCGKKIDKGFKDDVDDKTGVYVGGSGVGVDQLVEDGKVILGAASSGEVDYDHYKNDDKKLEAHRGRVVLRTLAANFRHDKSMDKSVLLDFHPGLIKSDGKGFFVFGTYFGKNYLAYVKSDGTKVVSEIDFQVKDMVLSNGKILLYNGTEKLYSVDTELSLQGVWEGNPDEDIKSSGVAALTKGRTAVFYNRMVRIFDHNFNMVNEVMMPENYLVSSVVSAEYTDEFLFRSLPQEKMLEKVVVYEAEDTETENDSDVDEAETDTDIESPDSDVVLMPMTTTDSDTEEDDSQTDAEEEVSDSDSEGTDVLDAKEGDVIWIASETGSVLAYDLESDSWMVTYYTESAAEDVSEYAVEMRPYLESSFKSYPEYGSTNLDNAPFIKKISVARGLAQSMIYNFTYEGIAEGSRSITGSIDMDSMMLTDKKADFQKMLYDVEHDRVILLDRRQNSECIIPLNTNITMDILSIDSPTEMTVSVEEFADNITSCYGEDLSYGIYPEDKYCVTREDMYGRSFAGRAEELSTGSAGEDVSFSDDILDISILRKTDDVKTSKETNYYIKINPGVPFVGLNSNDLIVNMVQTVPGKILMFSPMTRRYIEYDIESRTVVEVYK